MTDKKQQHILLVHPYGECNICDHVREFIVDDMAMLEKRNRSVKE